MAAEQPVHPHHPRRPRFQGGEDYFAGRYALMALLFALYQAWFGWLVWLGRGGLLTKPGVLLPSLVFPAMLWIALAVGYSLWERHRWRRAGSGTPGRTASDPHQRSNGRHWRLDLTLPLILFDAIALCFVSLILSLIGFMLIGLVWFER